MIHPIVKFGNPVLERPAEAVTAFDRELKKLVEDLFESMYPPHAVAAGPSPPARKGTGGGKDVNGKWFERTGEDLLARAFLHETDHLNGKLYISHISALKRDFMKRKIRKLIKAGEW